MSTLLVSLVKLRGGQRTLAVHLHTRDLHGIFVQAEVERGRNESYMPELVSKITDDNHRVNEMNKDIQSEEKSMKKTLSLNDDFNRQINNVMDSSNDVPVKQQRTHIVTNAHHNETNDQMNNIGYATDICFIN